jgi:hypothetical protein
MCRTCCEIRTELARIVVHQQNSKDPKIRAANRVKEARRDELLQQLESHSWRTTS